MLAKLKKLLEDYTPNWLDRINGSGKPTDRIFDGHYLIKKDDIEFIQSVYSKISDSMKKILNDINDPYVVVDRVHRMYDIEYLDYELPYDDEGEFI
ncbi:MAG: hypothetical protein QXG00_07960 [Candidatus Woesearchaeota archaeon]